MLDDINDAYQKVYGHPYDPATAAQPDAATTSQPAATPGHTKSRSQIAEEADKSASGQGEDEEPGIGGTLWDGAVGVAAGVEGFGKSLGKLTNDLAGTVGLKFADDSAFDSSLHTKTWLGGLTSGVTQFALGFIPALGLAGKVGAAAGITSKLVQSLAAGAASDFFDFSEHNQRLSNVIEQIPGAHNAVTDFLASKPDDTWAEGRLKNTLEGLGLGVAMHPLMEGLKALKGLSLAKAAGDTSAAQAVLKKAAPDIQAAMQRVSEGTAIVGTGSKAAGKMVSDFAKTVPSDVVDNFVAHVRDRYASLGTQALDEAVQTHFNFSRNITSDEVEGMTKFAFNATDKLLTDMRGGKMDLGLLKEAADERAELYGGNPGQMFADMSRDLAGTQNIARNLLTYRIMRNALGNQAYFAAERFASGGASEDLKSLQSAGKAYLNTLAATSNIQTNVARAVTQGRIETDGLVNSMDINKFHLVLDKIVNGGFGPAGQKQLAAMMTATKADPKSMLMFFDNMASKWGRKAGDVLNEVHRNAILFQVPAMATKFMGDLYNTVSMPMERILGGAWQQNASVMKSGARLFTNVMSHFLDFTNLFESADRVPKQVGSSLGSAFKAFTSSSVIIDHASEFESSRAISPQNFGLKDGSMIANAVKYGGELVNLPMKTLGSIDQFFKSVNYKGYVREEATRMAEEAGLQGQDYARFVNDHLTKAFGPEGQALNEGGRAYMKSASFSDDLENGIGKWVQDGANSHPLVKMVAPFVKTPTNIFRRAWQMTPGLNLLQSQYRQMAMSADPLKRAQAYGRATLGGMLWTLGIGMAASGRITGGGPSNRGEDNAQRDAGFQPYSFVTTGEDGLKRYISFKKLEPISYFLSLAADWHEAAGRMGDSDSGSMAAGMGYALAKNLDSHSYLTGIASVVNALSDPEHKLQTLLNTFAGSFVPAQLGKQDDTMHEARSMMDAIRRKIPGLSSDLPPTRDIFGQPVNTPGGYLPFGEGTQLARNVSPFAFSKQVNDPAKQELADLQYGFSKAPRNLPRNLGGFDLSEFHNPQSGQDAYDRFQELHGQAKIGGHTMSESLTRLINSERYQQLAKPDRPGDDTNDRVMAVRQVIAAYRQKALHQTIGEYPQIGAALKMYQQQEHAEGLPLPQSAPAK